MTSSPTEDAQKPGPGPDRPPGWVAAFQAVADVFSLIGGGLAVLCLVALTLLVVTEIVVAGLAKIIPSMPSSIHIGWEYSGYLMGGCFMLAAGLTFRAGIQIRVEALLRAGKGRQARFLEVVSSAVAAFATCFLAFALIQFAIRTFGYGEVSQDSFTPLWIPQSVLALGAIILAIQMVARFLASLFGGPLERPELGATSAVE